MSELSKLKPALDAVATRDRGRLIGRFRRLEKAGADAPADQLSRLRTDPTVRKRLPELERAVADGALTPTLAVEEIAAHMGV